MEDIFYTIILILKKRLYIKYIFIMCSLLTTCSVNSQDLHFSQFYFAPLQLNPALTGVFSEDLRFSANYRRQWKSVPVDYLTFSGVIDGKISVLEFENGFFSGGLIFNYDVAGDGNLSYTHFGASGSYTQKLSDQQLLTVGILFGTGQRRIEMNQLTFGNQFNGDLFVAGAPTRENLDQTSIFYMDFGAGLNWHLQDKEQRFGADIGVGVFHLTQPDVSFYDQNKTPLPRRLSFYGNSHFKISDKIRLELAGYYQRQNTYTESVAASGFRYQMTDTRGRELALRLGLGYRFIGARDALIPSVAVSYNAWIVGFSYDLNRSDFELATNGQGGPELALQYRITKVKPLKSSKVCPIF